MRAFGSKNAARACSTSPLPLTSAEPPLPNICRVQIWADQSTGPGAPEPGSKSKSATDSATSTNAPAFTKVGSLTSPASISTSCRQRSRSRSKNRRPQLRHRNRDTDYAQQPKPIPRAAAGGGETGRFATRGRQIPPPAVLRGDKHEAKSLNEGHLASEKK